MVKMQVPGYQVWVDPNAIMKIDIDNPESKGATLVRVYLALDDEPRVFEFATRQGALEFYETLWKLQSVPKC